MKRKTHFTFGISLFALLAVLLTGCNNDENAVRDAAYGYVMATGNFDLDGAMPYASQETRERTLPFLRDVILPQVLAYDTNYIQKNTPVSATIDSVLIKGDSAWVLFTKTTPVNVTQDELCLIREEGQWLVYVSLGFDNPESEDEQSADTTAATDAER